LTSPRRGRGSMSEVEDLRRELDELDRQRAELRKLLRELGLKKVIAHIRLMRTPEMREAYREAYKKVRYGGTCRFEERGGDVND